MEEVVKDIQQEETPKTFTQEEVNKIVQDRLARHKPDDYDDLKAISELLEDFDFAGTPTEKKEALKTAAQARREAAQADTYKESVEAYEGVSELPSDAVINALAKKWGKTPQAVEKALKKQIDSDEESDRKKQANEDFAKQVADFEKKFPDMDVEKLADNKKFVKFIKGKKLPLAELYADFVDFVGESDAEIETLKKTLKAKEVNEKNSATSTGNVKGDAPKGDFITFETFEKNKGNSDWLNKNYDTIIKSRPKW